MNNLLLYLGAFLVIIFSTLLGAPYFIDWNSYRGVFEEEASRVLGRDVRVAGKVELKLLPSPYFQVEKIRIGSASGNELNGSFFKTDDFKIWISIPPLLKGVLEAKSVELTRPVLQTAVDPEGRWAIGPSQSKHAGVYAFFNNITFQSVKIIDGTFRLVTPAASDLVRLEYVNGELSADAVDGPFRFAGQFVHEDETQLLRINTGKSDDKGNLRFKAQVISKNSTNTYTIEAVASDLFGRPSIEGDFKGKINGAYVLSKSLSGEPHLDFLKAQEALNLEFNSILKMTGSALSLDEITVNSESILPPKLLNGRGQITWKDQLAIDISFSSTQIDLDKILLGEANDNSKDPLEFLPALTRALLKRWPETAKVKFEVVIDELKAKKQNIKTLHLLAETVENSVQIKDARAILPGDTKLLLNGEISGGTNAKNFVGSLSLDGQKLNHFFDWIIKDSLAQKSEKDTSFSLTGEIKASSNHFQLAKIKLLTNSPPLNGEVKVSFVDRPQIKLDLQSDKIDLDAPAQLDVLGNLDVLSSVLPLEAYSTGERSSHAKERKIASWVQKVDWEVYVKTNVLKRMGAEVQNFEWAASSKNHKVSLSKIKFQSPNEFVIALQTPNPQGPAPSKNTLEGKIEVLSPKAEEKIFTLLNRSEDFKNRFQYWANLLPWNFDCVFNYEDSNENLLDFSLSGTVRDGRAEISGLLQDPFGDWQKKPARLSATLETPKISSLFGNTMGEMSASDNLAGNKSGKLFLSVEGKPAEGMQTLANIKTNDSDVEFKGALTVTDDKKILRDGNLVVDSRNLNEILLITGLFPQWTFQPVPIRGSLSIHDDGKKVDLKTEKILIGDTSVTAKMSWMSEKIEKLADLEANVSVDHMSVSSLLSILVNSVAKNISSSEKNLLDQASTLSNSISQDAPLQNTKNKASIWPEAPFDPSFIKQIEGVVRLNAESFDFQPNLSIKNSKLEFSFEKDDLQIKLVEGEALGGKAVSELQILPQPVGLSVKGQLAIDIPEVANKLQTEPNEVNKSSLSVSLTTKFEGKAYNPRNLIDILVGKGQVEIKRMALQGEGPKTIIDVSKAFMKDKILNSKISIADSLKEKLKTTKWEIKNITVPVDVAGAKFKIGKIEMNSGYGNSFIQTDLDLQTLDLTSIWSLSALIPSSYKDNLLKSQQKKIQGPEPFVQQKNAKIDALPTVNIIYSGGLGNLNTIEPTIIADALERELVVRRLELDVKELENLRKGDEEKSKVIPAMPENGNSENNDQTGNLTSGINKKELQPHNNSEAGQKNNPDFTSSTKNELPNQVQNLDLNDKKAEDQSLLPPTQSIEAIPLTPSKDTLDQTPQNLSSQKPTKKKPSESYWPSFDFWPF